MNAPPPHVTLYRYFGAAEAMRIRFEETLRNAASVHHIIENSQPLTPEAITKGLAQFAGEQGVFMLYWPAALYVVIEGFRELKLRDKKIEKLLESPDVDVLRLVRNATFHFQKQFISSKLTPFAKNDSVEWAWSLHEAFREFFQREFSFP
jgi:hypothetical protein